MKKIAIVGKANSGKDTVAKFFGKRLIQAHNANLIRKMAFADPLKEIIRIMFPGIPRKHLYGSSKYRSEIIPGAFKDGIPLTVRQLLLDIGTGLGRGYNDSIWLDNFDKRLSKTNQYTRNAPVIVTDTRFRNEFDLLKDKGFKMVKVIRDTYLNSNHISEVEQESIKDNEFDIIINNNSSLDDLKTTVFKETDLL